MCGIAGFVDFSGQDPEAAKQRLERMTNVLYHRGPDDSGHVIDNLVALGHRRLAIIDLAAGQQPMGILDGQIQLTFNGEIYNYLELRSDLRREGHRFETDSDTEVILYAYLQWGTECIERLHGMFSFALWDGRSKRLVLARDRVGKKPLYYYANGPVFAFASEIKALRAGEFGSDSIDPEALDCYFSLGFIPAPRTIYSDVKKLRGAHCVVIENGRSTERCYWKPDFSKTTRRSLNDATDELESLLDDAVRCRLMSEVPLGAFLSGGLDSSLVVSSMARLQTAPVATHTIGFSDSGFDETPVARAVAGHFQTDHHEYIVEPDASDVLEKIAWHFDEPLADSSALPTWYVCKNTRQSVTVALSGDGGDEAFGGYTFRYVPHVWESSLRDAIPPMLRSLIFGPLGSIWPSSARLPKALRLKTIFRNLAVGNAEAFYHDLSVLRAQERAAIYSGGFSENLRGFTPFETVAPFYSGVDASDALSRSQYADIHLYMTDDVLTKVDRMSMAHSLEVRSPLLDHRILEFAGTLPFDLKLQKGRGKLLLRNLAGRRLPEALRKLPKRGFSIPAAKWLRNELKPLAENYIFSKSSIGSEYLNDRHVHRIWSQHLDGSRDHSVFLWGLMMLEMWRKASKPV